MNWFEISIFAVPAILLVIALRHTYVARKASIAARWGSVLMGAGAVAAFVASICMDGAYDQHQVVFVTGFLLIVAGIGAGLVGSAATAGIER